jgi:hypothetical protein
VEAVMALYKEVYKDMPKAKHQRLPPFFTKSSVSPFAMHLYFVSSPQQLSARNTNLTPININTNVCMIINHKCTHFNVSYISGSNNPIFPLMS